MSFGDKYCHKIGFCSLTLSFSISIWTAMGFIPLIALFLVH